MAEVTTGTVLYTIDAATLLVSSSDANRRMIDLINKALAVELLDYSPALGSKLAFAAGVVARLVSGTIVSIDDPPAEKGRVY